MRKHRKILFSVGLDIKKERINHCLSKHLHSYYVLADVRNLPFREKSIDVVLCLDLIEHLRKHEGMKLIEELALIAKKQIIVHAPNGFMPTSGELFDLHRSAWNVHDFKGKGFKVFGDSGFRLPSKFKRVNLFKDLRKSKIYFFVGFLDYIVGEAMVYNAPYFAYQLLCIKEIPDQTCS